MGHKRGALFWEIPTWVAPQTPTLFGLAPSAPNTAPSLWDMCHETSDEHMSSRNLRIMGTFGAGLGFRVQGLGFRVVLQVRTSADAS